MTASDLRPGPDETLDAFHHGRVLVLQKKKGYRFSVDAPLLADFVRPGPDDELLEFGTGCGIIPLLLGAKSYRHITALELQSVLADLARRNVALNGLGSKITIVQADYRDYAPGRTFDGVFSNPPYIRGAAGEPSLSPEKTAAKHELRGGVSDIMRRTRECLRPGGRAWFVYPESRRADFLAAAAAEGLALRRSRDVRPREGAAANLFLAELGCGPGETAVLPPLVLFGPEGRPTAEAEEIYSGRSAS
jgi:tRNA1Val (adenine37-N6)-methyltransferase